jgi:hypothetical protein
VTLLLFLWTAMSMRTPGATRADDPRPLEVRRADPSDRWLRTSDNVSLILSRPLVADEERLAIVIADADWTSLFELSGDSLSYKPGPVRLPSGESVMTVYLVTAPNTWRSLATMPLRVTTPSGFESVAVTPRATVGDLGQIAEAHAPAANKPPRHEFQDVTLGLGLQSQHVRDGVTYATQTNLLGVTNQTQAPRFPATGAAAPQLDLTDYVWTAEAPRFKVAMGQNTFAGERHLVSAGLQSRGLSLTLRRPRADLTLSEFNGNTIVGFDNFLGVSVAQNRVTMAQAGAELVPRSGGARLEVTAIHGTRLPQAGVSQGSVTDAEQSTGGALRFAGNALRQRLRVDAGFARSSFTNPPDPLLSQGVALVPLKPRTNDATYVDSAFDVVKALRIRPHTPLTVTTIYKFERVDPLFSSVGAAQGLRSDLFQNVVGVQATAGGVTGQVLRTVSNDNLHHVASILRTDTGITAASVLVPTATFGQSPGNAVWWPVVSYALNRSSQVGEGLPPNGGFISASQVPNQLNTVNTLRSEWTFARAHAAYQLTRSFQDNRQEGRELADFSNLVNGVSMGTVIRQRLDVTAELGFERAFSLETHQLTRTTHVGLTGTWRVTERQTVSAIVNDTIGRGPDLVASDAADLSLQYSRTFVLRARATTKRQLQLFGRTNWQSSSAFQGLAFGPPDRRHVVTATIGFTLTFF